MIIKIISGTLIFFTFYMGIKHGWTGLNMKPGNTGPQVDLVRKINLSEGALKIFSALLILSALLIVAPQTFLAGNLLNAVLIVFLMAMFLHVKEFKAALIEIPFLLIPLILIYFGHPFVTK